MYVGILYIFKVNNRLQRITNKLSPFFIPIVSIYKQTRMYYILVKVIFLLVCLISIIWLGGRVVIGLLL